MLEFNNLIKAKSLSFLSDYNVLFIPIIVKTSSKKLNLHKEYRYYKGRAFIEIYL